MWFGMAVAVGNAIAAGIVRTPGEIAKSLPNPWLFLGGWGAGGIYALFGASSMAELVAAIPRSGGQYNFSRRALGDYAGLVDGWDGIIYFGEEVRDPGRDIPRAIFGSVFSVMGIYLLLNLVALYILPMNQIAGNDFVLGAMADRVFGRFGDPTIRTIMIISMLSNINSNLLFSSRTLHAMSSDGLFFRRVARVNRGGTPSLSLLLSTIVSVFFVLGSFERVIAMLSFFFVANYTLTYTSVFVLRGREPQANRPYRACAYP